MMRCSRFVSEVLVGGALFAGLACKDHNPFAKNDNSTQSTAPTDKNAMNAQPTITRSDFGATPAGEKVDLYTLTSGRGVVAKIITYGGIITELHVPDKSGKQADIVLGFNNLKQYTDGHPYFGAIAGRYANRIAKGKFTLDGKEYTLPVNNGPNSLHGGIKGFDKAVWKAERSQSADSVSLKLNYVSRNGEEGFPGNLDTIAVYTLNIRNELKLELMATTDNPTVVNLTNHSYFNLAGESSGTILDEVLTLNADKFTPTDDVQIPTGELKSVKGTALDFTTPHTLGERIAEMNVPPSLGYDHNFVINGGGGKLVMAAKAKDPKSGRVMELWTTQPGVQLYTANFLDGKIKGIGGTMYQKNDAFCLETQHFPDAPNHPDFPTTTLNPGQKYNQVTVWKFSAE